MELTLQRLLLLAVEKGASDVHLQSGSRPVFRIQGEVFFLDTEVLPREVVEGWLRPLMSEEQYATFLREGDVDLAYQISPTARFRVNALHHQRGCGAVFRLIPSRIPTLKGLGLPSVLERIALLKSGLVLVTGPTGSGKSTTLAAMLGVINQRTTAHVITIEDPIEYVHPYERAIIEQREVGTHAPGFAEAVRSALRESPDVIMVGEMRDLETMRQALRAAETGHLVLSTLHTNSAVKTVNRIVDVFPAGEQSQVRSVLSATLKAVISQKLVPEKNSARRLAAMEIMLVNQGIASLIRERKTSQIMSFIMMGGEEGMQSLEDHLTALYREGRITGEAALRYCNDREVLIRRGLKPEGAEAEVPAGGP